jgi:hypothetical protein
VCEKLLDSGSHYSSNLGSLLIKLKFMQIPAFDLYGWIYNTKNSKVKGWKKETICWNIKLFAYF